MSKRHYNGPSSFGGSTFDPLKALRVAVGGNQWFANIEAKRAKAGLPPKTNKQGWKVRKHLITLAPIPPAKESD